MVALFGTGNQINWNKSQDQINKCKWIGRRTTIGMGTKHFLFPRFISIKTQLWRHSATTITITMEESPVSFMRLLLLVLPHLQSASDRSPSQVDENGNWDAYYPAFRFRQGLCRESQGHNNSEYLNDQGSRLDMSWCVVNFRYCIVISDSARDWWWEKCKRLVMTTVISSFLKIIMFRPLHN